MKLLIIFMFILECAIAQENVQIVVKTKGQDLVVVVKNTSKSTVVLCGKWGFPFYGLNANEKMLVTKKAFEENSTGKRLYGVGPDFATRHNIASGESKNWVIPISNFVFAATGKEIIGDFKNGDAFFILEDGVTLKIRIFDGNSGKPRADAVPAVEK